MSIRWSRRALDDLDAIGEYIATDRPRTAVEWVARLVRRAEQIVEHPRGGRLVPERDDPALREVIEKGYRIVYRVLDDEIVVVTVFEGHRLLRDP